MINSDKQNKNNSSDSDRWASLIGGGALVLFGLSQRSLRGALLAVAGGAITATVAKLFGEIPQQQIADDLGRFKQFMETGEIATTEGQSSGRQ